MHQKLYNETKNEENFKNMVALQHLKSSILFYKAFLNPNPFWGVALIVIGTISVVAVVCLCVWYYYYVLSVWSKSTLVWKSLYVIFGTLLIFPALVYGISNLLKH